jgi:PIN domain nuclease of toxin-antitoxin system
MKLLLDTHIFIWQAEQPQKLTPKVQAALKNPNNELILSVVSVWEMQIKAQIGKLHLSLPIQDFVRLQRVLNNIESLPVIEDHIWALRSLPMHHKDPFDRLLIAQAIAEKCQIVTVDSVFTKYSVPLFR